MKSPRTDLGIETQNRILRLVLSAPAGMSTDAVQQATGLCRSTCNNLLQILASDGRLATTHQGAGALWCHPSQAADLYDAIRERVTSRARSKQARSDLKRREQEAEDWANAKPVRIIVQARAAKPIRPAKPASVFDLA